MADKRKILVVDTGLALDVVRKLAQEGNEVYYFENWIKAHPEQEDLSYGEGLFEEWGVNRVDNFWHLVDDVDMVLFTDIGWGDDIDFLRREGCVVFGAGKEGEELENDRVFAKSICKECGLDVPETYSMNPDEAIDFVNNEDREFVLKFSKVRTDLLSTYLPVCKEDCLWYLNKVKELDSNVEVILEERIEGVECAISGFFNGYEFVEPYLINFEHKKLMDGEVGPNTGEMGNCAIYTYNSGLPFVKYFNNLSGYLKDIGYRGIIDIDCMCNEDGFYVLEFTCRFGYPMIMIQSVLHKDNLGDILFGVATGEIDRFEAYDNLWVVGVCLNIAGYPFDDVVKKSGFVKIFGLEEALENGYKIGFQALCKKEDGYYSVPGHGRVLVINGTGDDISSARGNAYGALDYIGFSDMMYRLDIGLKVEKRLDNLVEWGVIDDKKSGIKY